MQYETVTDNRALARASEEAINSDIPLVVLFVICRAEYILHDRSPMRIDFMLRNLAALDVCSFTHS
jgi:deoxyribodipyrimidine photo-lyase